MTRRLHTSYPAISDLALKAKKRIPHFAWEYLDSGTGEEDCLVRNRQAFSDVTLTPKFMQGKLEPNLKTSLFGVEYDYPFGMGPVGLTGLMWPGAEKILAKTAATCNIPYTLSTVATESAETIGPLTEGRGWFQLYPPYNDELRHDLLKRAKAAGFTTLVVTADVPTGSRRERQVRAGVSVPPRRTLRTYFHAAIRPEWTLATLKYGEPRFKGLESYLDSKDLQNMLTFMGKAFGGNLDWGYLASVREQWDGPIVLKGVLDAETAAKAAAMGFEGIVVSNHGGRQCDASPASMSALPEIKSAVDGEIKILLDRGVRTGLDIARAIALGADFVLLGRAFMYGVAALGKKGGVHTAEILADDLENNMIQLGCNQLSDLPLRLKR